MKRQIFTHAVALFLGAGVFASSLMGSALPLINWRGHIYIMFAWPQMVYCAPIERGCDPVPPEWLGVYLFNVEARHD